MECCCWLFRKIFASRCFCVKVERFKCQKCFQKLAFYPHKNRPSWGDAKSCAQSTLLEVEFIPREGATWSSAGSTHSGRPVNSITVHEIEKKLYNWPFYCRDDGWTESPTSTLRGLLFFWSAAGATIKITFVELAKWLLFGWRRKCQS